MTRRDTIPNASELEHDRVSSIACMHRLNRLSICQNIYHAFKEHVMGTTSQLKKQVRKQISTAKVTCSKITVGASLLNTRKSCKLQGYVHNMAQSSKRWRQLRRNTQATERPARNTRKWKCCARGSARGMEQSTRPHMSLTVTLVLSEHSSFHWENVGRGSLLRLAALPPSGMRLNIAFRWDVMSTYSRLVSS
jgi:hypothetical protein